MTSFLDPTKPPRGVVFASSDKTILGGGGGGELSRPSSHSRETRSRWDSRVNRNMSVFGGELGPLQNPGSVFWSSVLTSRFGAPKKEMSGAGALLSTNMPGGAAGKGTNAGGPGTEDPQQQKQVKEAEENIVSIIFHRALGKVIEAGTEVSDGFLPNVEHKNVLGFSTGAAFCSLVAAVYGGIVTCLVDEKVAPYTADCIEYFHEDSKVLGESVDPRTLKLVALDLGTSIQDAEAVKEHTTPRNAISNANSLSGRHAGKDRGTPSGAPGGGSGSPWRLDGLGRDQPPSQILERGAFDLIFLPDPSRTREKMKNTLITLMQVVAEDTEIWACLPTRGSDASAEGTLSKFFDCTRCDIDGMPDFASAAVGVPVRILRMTVKSSWKPAVGRQKLPINACLQKLDQWVVAQVQQARNRRKTGKQRYYSEPVGLLVDELGPSFPSISEVVCGLLDVLAAVQIREHDGIAKYRKLTVAQAKRTVTEMAIDILPPGKKEPEKTGQRGSSSTGGESRRSTALQFFAAKLSGGGGDETEEGQRGSRSRVPSIKSVRRMRASVVGAPQDDTKGVDTNDPSSPSALADRRKTTTATRQSLATVGLPKIQTARGSMATEGGGGGVSPRPPGALSPRKVSIWAPGKGPPAGGPASGGGGGQSVPEETEAQMSSRLSAFGSGPGKRLPIKDWLQLANPGLRARRTGLESSLQKQWEGMWNDGAAAVYGIFCCLICNCPLFSYWEDALDRTVLPEGETPAGFSFATMDHIRDIAGEADVPTPSVMKRSSIGRRLSMLAGNARRTSGGEDAQHIQGKHTPTSGTTPPSGPVQGGGLAKSRRSAMQLSVKMDVAERAKQGAQKQGGGLVPQPREKSSLLPKAGGAQSQVVVQPLWVHMSLNEYRFAFTLEEVWRRLTMLVEMVAVVFSCFDATFYQNFRMLTVRDVLLRYFGLRIAARYRLHPVWGKVAGLTGPLSTAQVVRETEGGVKISHFDQNEETGIAQQVPSPMIEIKRRYDL
uniref:Uncharacterized protein n=1 Tax=Chromera velia CCMP2878 TaxID=1169474 RepID=A0A0G4EZL7_9ALVE|eukprot:Cvel_14296.t1-p1 / transcript=Cvel_14296.t1 / gene=Cvel_14296 / organism=Chromera_velia_CCMP2878 / gene_product=hypothetical protein / transcript_product=hypothetical protein / location=Cvel_scaffold1010:27872-33205(-) / protein_length=1000 / sequence_SO=supercontig / SO=protein_coding / is_pseudo=false